MGEISVWFRGGGHKRRYRAIDFKRDKIGVPATVATIEYDPNRSANLALLHYLGWREALHSAAGGAEGRHEDHGRPRRRHSGRQRAAA